MSNLASYFANPQMMQRVLKRFREMTPRLQADPRFYCGVALAGDRYVPYVCEACFAAGEDMPPRYVYVIEVTPGKYHVRMHGMFILLGVGVPAKCLPFAGSEERLDTDILNVWERWYEICAAVGKEIPYPRS